MPIFIKRPFVIEPIPLQHLSSVLSQSQLALLKTRMLNIAPFADIFYFSFKKSSIAG
jgi:hypothetical protein